MLKSIIRVICIAALGIVTFASCTKGKSYAELLNEETYSVNYYLSNYRVINEIPADSVFEAGKDAPYYRIDPDGNLYMQVVNPGDPERKAEYNERIYFRFTRYNLNYFRLTNQMMGSGNADDFNNAATYFDYGNAALTSASSYGMGIQEPLKYLGLDCEVNIVIKSQLGPSSEIASVVPYLYNVRYFPAAL